MLIVITIMPSLYSRNLQNLPIYHPAMERMSRMFILTHYYIHLTR